MSRRYWAEALWVLPTWALTSFLGETADFLFENGGDVGHGGLLCGIVENLPILRHIQFNQFSCILPLPQGFFAFGLVKLDPKRSDGAFGSICSVAEEASRCRSYFAKTFSRLSTSSRIGAATFLYCWVTWLRSVGASARRTPRFLSTTVFHYERTHLVPCLLQDIGCLSSSPRSSLPTRFPIHGHSSRVSQYRREPRDGTVQ